MPAGSRSTGETGGLGPGSGFFGRLEQHHVEGEAAIRADVEVACHGLGHRRLDGADGLRLQANAGDYADIEERIGRLSG